MNETEHQVYKNKAFVGFVNQSLIDLKIDRKQYATDKALQEQLRTQFDTTYNKVESGRPIIEGVRFKGISGKVKIWQIGRFISKFIKKQKSIDPEMAEIANKNYKDLLY